MGKSNIMICLEKKEEHQKVENLIRESFWNVYRPGCLEHYVLHQLRNDPAFVPELDQRNGKCSYETDKNLLDDYLKYISTAVRKSDSYAKFFLGEMIFLS